MVNTVISLVSNRLNAARTLGVSVLMAVLMLFSVSTFAAEIDAAVDRNPVSITDSFQLTYSANESPDDDPDFSPLKQDFDILNQQKSSQLSWINGESNRTIQWTLTLMAKRSGDLTIPAISFGDDKTQALSLSVTETSQLSTPSDNDEIFIKAEVSDTTPYVQAQVVYTVRIFQRVNFAKASLSEPELANTVVEKLGQDSQYNTKIKGVNYLVTERKYALYPQQSGSLTIAPLVLTAQIVSVSGHQSPFDSFFTNPNTQTKRVISESINLNVQATPANFTANHWLPAQQLELKQMWSNTDLQVKVGEPITRTLSIVAKGVTSSQLPDLTADDSNPQLKVYPDQALDNDLKAVTGITATREQKIAFIPSKAGSYELPAIEIPWFNTQTKQQELAKLPAVTLVAIAAQQTSSSSNNIPATSQTTETEPATASVETKQTITKTSPEEADHTIWIWSSVFFAVAWLLTLFYWYKSRSNQSATTVSKTDSANDNLKQIFNSLSTACDANDAQAAHKALTKWASAYYHVSNLAALSEHCDKSLQTEINKLNQALYGKQKLVWEGAALLQAVIANQASKSAPSNEKEPLQPLYPS